MRTTPRHIHMQPYKRASEKQAIDQVIATIVAEQGLHHAWSSHAFDGMPKPVQIEYADGTTGYCTTHRYGR